MITKDPVEMSAGILRDQGIFVPTPLSTGTAGSAAARRLCRGRRMSVGAWSIWMWAASDVGWCMIDWGWLAW